MAKKKPEAAKQPEAPAVNPAPTPAPEKVTQPTANGVTRPKAGTTCGRIWEMADKLSATINAPADRKSILTQAEVEGINAATAATQYGKWCKFYGISKPRAEKAAEAPAEAAAEEVAEEVEEEAEEEATEE